MESINQYFQNSRTPIPYFMDPALRPHTWLEKIIWSRPNKMIAEHFNDSFKKRHKLPGNLRHFYNKTKVERLHNVQLANTELNEGASLERVVEVFYRTFSLKKTNDTSFRWRRNSHAATLKSRYDFWRKHENRPSIQKLFLLFVKASTNLLRFRVSSSITDYVSRPKIFVNLKLV